jgi:hypothetical protein
MATVLLSGLTPEPGFAVGLSRVSARHGGAAPGRPTHLTATVQNDKVVLAWHEPAVTATTGVPTDYLVFWTAPPLLPLAGEADTHSTHTSYTSVFGPGTYEVEAENAKGTGPPSKPVTVCQSRSTAPISNCPVT